MQKQEVKKEDKVIKYGKKIIALMIIYIFIAILNQSFKYGVDAMVLLYICLTFLSLEMVDIFLSFVMRIKSSIRRIVYIIIIAVILGYSLNLLTLLSPFLFLLVLFSALKELISDFRIRISLLIIFFLIIFFLILSIYSEEIFYRIVMR